ncbi:imidazoleglycerol-phosphate dehydratase HisB [Pectinatus brassicae]|uniref:Imidazoleglycerol-phosphate dehydratase n=1 Tax=Pectinatus brassicae TaxID=862415 RepID=A0A840UH46_9FIRM|nr:imidazoleglycerol-phosphate dehydratase HisB [Pectinatus brassicae]MBB5336329.1 imidazoleglycerol-phosphate dehydratase [Pectinatus brassicae]
MRQSAIKRKTAETTLSIKLNLDGSGKHNIDTNIGFFDHMLTLLSVHSLIDLDVKCIGDIEVDGHHSVEDTGIVLGDAFMQAIGNRQGIKRYGTFYIPMDESLAMVSLDISNRPYLVYEVGDLAPMIGSFDSELAEEFFRAFAVHAGLTLHIKVLYGKNSHHKIEAVFKALGHALREAVENDPKVQGVPSSKGVL